MERRTGAIQFERSRQISCRSEIKVQPELDDAVRIKRCAADCAESSSLLRGSCWKITDGWVTYRFSKLWVIRQVENSSLKRQLRLLATRDLKIFLDVEVKIVCARVANVCVEPRRIAKGLGDVAAAGRRGGCRIHQSRSRTGSGEVHC